MIRQTLPATRGTPPSLTRTRPCAAFVCHEEWDSDDEENGAKKFERGERVKDRVFAVMALARD